MSASERSSTRTIAIAVGLAVVLVAGVVIYLSTRDQQPKVLLLGDSITVISGKVFKEELKDDYRVEVSGASSMRADERVSDAEVLAKTDPDGVVVNLGTNDVIQSRPTTGTLDALDKIGSGFKSARCVALVTVNEDMFNSKNATLGPDSKAVNKGIRALARTKGWKVVPWDEIVHKYLVDGEPQGRLSVDTVHPTELGKKLLADAYSRALSSCF